MIEIEVNTPRREALVNVTGLLEGALLELGFRDGLLHVFSPHTTAGVLIQEGADPMVAHDLLLRLRELFPHEHPGYRHLEGNSDAHLKTAVVGNAVLVPVAGGRLKLGTWQQVFLAEFDGPRRRRLWLSAVGGR